MANGCLQLRGQLVEGKDLGMMSALAKEISTTKVKVRVLGEECLIWLSKTVRAPVLGIQLGIFRMIRWSSSFFLIDGAMLL